MDYNIQYDLINYVTDWCCSENVEDCKLILQKLGNEIGIQDLISKNAKLPDLCPPKDILDKVLNPAPRKVVTQPIKKKDPVINDRTDLLYTNPKPLVRTIKPNKPDNRQELINLKNNTNKLVNKQLFSTKPERRTGINHITIGGKSKM